MPTWWGNIHRQSRSRCTYRRHSTLRKAIGGAANVAKNIAALGAKPILCSVIGEDDEGFFKL